MDAKRLVAVQWVTRWLGRSVPNPGCVSLDRVPKDRPERLGSVVAHVCDDHELGTGDQLGGSSSAAWGDERVVGAMDHQHREP